MASVGVALLCLLLFDDQGKTVALKVLVVGR